MKRQASPSRLKPFTVRVRIGLRTIILPRRNELDLDDVPDEIKKSMKFIFVDTVDEVIKAALLPVSVEIKAKPAKSKAKTTAREKKENVKSTTS